MIVFANVLQPLIDLFEAILKAFHSTGIGWGMSIVALTVVVRAALLPLTLKQFRSMQNLARFQPEIKKLQEKHKDDRERLNQEMMKFYRENKVNPLASCLPLAAQLPVFLSLFYMLRKDLRHDICPAINPQTVANPRPCGAGGDAQFLFIHDLTSKATGGVLITLMVLYVGSQLLSTILMSTATDRTQRLIFLALPFVFVGFVFTFPAGLLVYWITTNLWTIVQQMIVKSRIGPMRPVTEDGQPPPMSLMDRMIHRTRRDKGGTDAIGRPTGGSAGTGPAAVAASAPSSAPSTPKPRPSGPPPASPRKRKKRSGRRR